MNRKFQPGDRVVFNANLDKSPDPDNAHIVGIVERYAEVGERVYQGTIKVNDRMQIAFVKWDPQTVTPVADDWLEPAEATQ